MRCRCLGRYNRAHTVLVITKSTEYSGCQSYFCRGCCWLRVVHIHPYQLVELSSVVSVIRVVVSVIRVDRPIITMSSPQSPLLELRDLGCERDERLLFSGLNLQLAAGEVVQIGGPNGAGKTTLLRALAGISGDYQGQIFYAGQPLPEACWDFARDRLYLGHLPGIKKSLTPSENLAWYLAQTGGRISIDEALAAVGLYGYEDTPCYQLSAGQLRRVALARLHLAEARVWILDEPFTAIDKLGVTQLEALIARQSAQGGVVILTSHQDLSLPQLRLVNLQDYRPAPTKSIQGQTKAVLNGQSDLQRDEGAVNG